MSKSGLKDESNFTEAATCAENMRKAPAGTYHGGKPPSGPEKEPTLINKVPLIKQSGISGKGSK